MLNEYEFNFVSLKIEQMFFLPFSVAFDMCDIDVECRIKFSLLSRERIEQLWRKLFQFTFVFYSLYSIREIARYWQSCNVFFCFWVCRIPK